MTYEQLIINQARKIEILEHEKEEYKSWYYKATEEILELRKTNTGLKIELTDSQVEIQQLQQKLNYQDCATINTNEHPKHG
jgi:predicted  nucleic acid-binding Zn-ribbon protein